VSEIISKNPFTGQENCRFTKQTLEESNQIIDQLNQTQKVWRQADLTKRISLVKHALNYFTKYKEDIALDICESMGRPLHQAKGEVDGMLGRAQHLCSIAEETLAPDIYTDQEGFTRSIEHVALGTIFVISAWNYPLLITINSVIPALISGNTVLLKHSSLTPKIGEHFQKAFGELGEYKNLLKNIVVDHKTTGEIIEKLNIHHVIFTGSVTGGQQILKHTSKKFMMPGLELGGKDGAYVHSDANLAYAVETIVDGAMFNSGQSCCGMERAYIHENLYDQFIQKAQGIIAGYKLGDPKEESTNLGPLASAKSATYMKEQVEDAKKKGAKILVGGEIEEINKGTFFQATLIADANNEMDVMQEENFGPILPVMKVRDQEEAINLINDSEYGLTSAIFTQDESVAREFANEAETGTVFMNRCDYLDPALPWTGVKNSGCGSSLSKYGFMHVTRRKSIHFKTKI
jgi:acyl-CoA reductase-like NAD-dependent aldehyde dehydrogenase